MIVALVQICFNNMLKVRMSDEFVETATFMDKVINISGNRGDGKDSGIGRVQVGVPRRDQSEGQRSAFIYVFFLK